jgi:hypothetical protein
MRAFRAAGEDESGEGAAPGRSRSQERPRPFGPLARAELPAAGGGTADSAREQASGSVF